jgi:hypothetical protein
MRKSILTGIFLLVFAALAAPQEVSFKLTGGWAWIDGDDYNSGIAGENAYIKDTSLTMSGAYGSLKSGANIQLEIVNSLNRWMGIGFGGGYYQVTNESQVMAQGLLSGVPFENQSTSKARISVIPFFLNFHYLVGLTTKTNLDIYAGPLFQIVQFNFENPSTTSVLSTRQTITFTASQISLGLQGGIGLDYEIASGVALIAEACYRYGKVSNLRGNWADLGSSDSGPISNTSSDYYMWAYNYIVQSGTYRMIGFFDKDGPAGDSISGARKADINLSGFTALAGIKFSF